MVRRGSSLLIALAATTLAGLAACDRADVTSADAVAADEAAFADMQDRGRQAMGVDQYTSTHVFDVLPDGGRIELQRDADDPAAVARIREHLQQIARAFDAGDFSTPTFVHMEAVPGSSVMAAKREAITYTYRELPRGGVVRLVTQDPQALQAIHEFMSFQRQDHRVGGMEHGQHDATHHAPHDHRGAHDAQHDHTGMDHGQHDHAAHDHAESHRGPHDRGTHHGSANHEGHGQGGM
jgi:hypothetical protein